MRVRIDVLKQSIVAPTAAIQRGPTGPFVYLVASADQAKATVKVAPVTIAQQDDLVAVVTKGLALGDQVVTSGFARLKDQAAITIIRVDTGDVAASATGPDKTDGAASAIPAPSGTEKTLAPAAEAPAASERVRRADGTDGPRGERRNRRNKPESAVQ